MYRKTITLSLMKALLTLTSWHVNKDILQLLNEIFLLVIFILHYIKPLSTFISLTQPEANYTKSRVFFLSDIIKCLQVQENLISLYVDILVFLFPSFKFYLTWTNLIQSCAIDAITLIRSVKTELWVIRNNNMFIWHRG